MDESLAVNSTIALPAPDNVSAAETDTIADNLLVSDSNHGVAALQSQVTFSEEEVRRTLETSAATGKFWKDWEKLRSILSYHLKQVLSEYPEAKLSTEQQTASLGESFQQLLKRLNDALYSFVEGPPFTLQRLCEILLSARSIYPKLTKLSLALEKNLLVTSTLTVSAEPSSPALESNTNGDCEEKTTVLSPTDSVVNGVEPALGDRDEIMTEVEEADVDVEMTMDIETIENTVKSSEADPTPTMS